MRLLSKSRIGNVIANLLKFCVGRDVFMEKHWKSVISKSICDYFFEAQRKVSKTFTFLFIKQFSPLWQ